MRNVFLTLLGLLASCSAHENEPQPERQPNVQVAVWPESWRADLITGLGLTSASPLNNKEMEARSLAAGGIEADPSMTPAYLLCLDVGGHAQTNHTIRKFMFRTFAGPRPASITYAFDDSTGRLICADMFRPKE